MVKVIFPATVAASLLAVAAALADEVPAPPSIQVVGPALTRELATRTSEQISAAVAEAIRPKPAESAGEGDGGARGK